MRKREFENQSIEDRDNGQRSLGYVGLSAIAHVALLIAVVLAPSFKEQIKNISGIDSGATVELGNSAAEQAAPAVAAAAPSDAQPTTGGEVMLADANDPTGVNVPEEKPAVTEPAPQAAEPAPQVIAKPIEKIAKPVVAKISKPKVAAAPAVKAEPAVLEGDVAVKEAEPTEEKPEPVVEAKVPAEEKPVLKEEKPEPVLEAAAVTPTKEDANAEDAKEEEKPVAVAAAPVAVEAKPETKPEPKAEPKPETPSSSNNRSLLSAIPKMNSGNPNAFGTSSGTSTSASANQAPVTNNTNGNGNAAAAATGGAIGAAAAAGAPVRDARSLVAMPGNPKPVYPLADKLAGRQGTSVLLGRVRPDGTIGEVAVEKSSGSRMMDQSAANAFKNWKYKPGQEGLVRLPVQFQLVGDAKVMPTALRRQ